MKTKAAVLWEPGKPWSVEEVDVAEPGPGEVLVKMTYAGLCHSDDHNVTGDFPGVAPLVGGHEGAGEVVAAGEGVDRVTVGDAVMLLATPACGVCRFCSSGRSYLCDANADVLAGLRPDGSAPFASGDRKIGAYAQLGTFAEHTVVRQTQLLPYERDIPDACAAIVSCGVVTGYGSTVRAAQVRPGQTVVVVGAGGVGMSAVQGARIAGAARIVAVDPQPFKREQALEFGATHTAESMEEAAPLVRDLTRGVMADAVVLTVGVLDGEMLAPADQLTAKGGKIVLTSVARHDDDRPRLPLSPFLLSAKSLIGVVFGLTNSAADVNAMLDLYRSGSLRLDEMVTRKYSLDEIAAGYEDMHAGKNLRGVIEF
ncbi:NDMA-dependent alcohol dehydrogenase [Actinomadura sp. LD22]|uniref:NDMA-dependent alcohol dehydrogenase n=1 Tax=Actinomadura physcomitrii TaxID=2650748 RepID=A0A6I4M6R8_9ACTN|nr:NDMA-dependent alcohol dehydrogenase [Actinomadura physcomitrii]MVZ99856.1 NDMA-dependent alcohol dehydrogenase [Actinomadura physcomitrii]